MHNFHSIVGIIDLKQVPFSTPKSSYTTILVAQMFLVRHINDYIKKWMKNFIRNVVLTERRFGQVAPLIYDFSKLPQKQD